VGSLAIKLERRGLVLPAPELRPELFDGLGGLEYMTTDQ